MLKFLARASLRWVGQESGCRANLSIFFLQGIGRNYRIAKCTAAKCALKALRKQKEKEVRRKK